MQTINESLNSRISTLQPGHTIVIANEKHNSATVYRYPDGNGYTITQNGVGKGYRHINEVLDKINTTYKGYKYETQFGKQEW